MKYVINTKQRIYVDENKITIVIYRRFAMTIKKDTYTIILELDGDIIYRKKFRKKFFESFRKDVSILLTQIFIELLLFEYHDEVMDILSKNCSYIQKAFDQFV